MSCSCCFEDYIGNCSETIIIKGNLPAGSYTYVIRDKFNKRYEGTVVTDEEGSLSIPVTDFPDGYFNEYAGLFRLEITASGVYNPVAMLLLTDSFGKENYYDCVIFYVVGGNHTKNTIGW